MQNPGKQRFGAGLGDAAVAHLDHMVCNQIKKHNSVRSKADRQAEELASLQQRILDIDSQNAYLASNKEGASVEARRLRELENALDKATIKGQEAFHIGKTYQMIIDKLLSDRLNFDNEVTALEERLKARRTELEELEELCASALASRDQARAELAQADREASEARKKREREKRELTTAADEQRKKFEAMERRLRNVPTGELGGDGDAPSSSTVKRKILSYEEAMRQIQDVTGVLDVQEVVDRFLSQGDTQKHLKELQEANTAELARLQAEHARVTKAYEALKYSGEARNTANQRTLTEFEKHLTDATSKCENTESRWTNANSILVKVKAGVDHMYDKMGTLKPIQFRAASHVKDKLSESNQRLVKLMEELEQRKSELIDLDISAPLVLPEHNNRIAVAMPTEKEKQEDSQSEDEDVITRDQIKKQAESMIDSKTKKKTRKKKKRM